MSASFTTAEILAATGGTLVHQGAWDTFCVGTDSRTTQTGELFIPLTGADTTATNSFPPPCAGAPGAF